MLTETLFQIHLFENPLLFIAFTNLPGRVRRPSQSIRDLHQGSTTAALDIRSTPLLDFPTHLCEAAGLPCAVYACRWTSPRYVRQLLDFSTMESIRDLNQGSTTVALDIRSTPYS